MSTMFNDLIDSKLSDLVTPDLGEPLFMPEWCNFYMRLAARARMIQTPGIRRVFGLSVPTKAFAAPFLAAGAAIACSLATPYTDLYALSKFGSLKQLPIGTLMVYRSPNSNNVKKCVLDGFECANSQEMIRIKIAANGNLTKQLPPRLALGLEPLDDVAYALRGNQNGRSIISDEEYRFLCKFLGKKSAGEFLAYSRIECIVFGPTSTFREEMDSVNLCIRNDTNETVPLSAILGARNSADRNSAIHTSLIPASRESPEVAVNNSSVVILNGANATLNHYYAYPKSNCIAVLDRTEPRFLDAVNLLKMAFYERLDASDTSFRTPIPPAIEYVEYAEPT